MKKKDIKVIIVEDDVLIRLLTNKILMRNKCTIVGETSYAEESIEMARNFNPDLICMDIKLAGNMDGIEAAKILDKTSKIPIVFISAYDYQNKIDQLKLKNKKFFLEKPIDEKKLVDIIDKI
ncbi:MAG: response regulator [Spirochaetes bacterium]|nr:response regulator [Spirochaetota bacterium]